MWQLASIHRHLDEMDRKFNAMQLEMEDALVMSEYDVLVGSLNKTSGSDNAVRNDANTNDYHLYTNTGKHFDYCASCYLLTWWWSALAENVKGLTHL